MIQPPLTDENDGVDRIIIPEVSKEILAVSQDAVKNPEQVSLIMNLQVWSFELDSESEKRYV